MPFIRATHPEAGDNINGVQFVPHPDGKGKVSVLSVAADLAQIFCDVPGFETCPDPGLPQSPAPVSEGTKPFDQMTVEEHKAEIEALQALIAEHQSAIIAANLASLKSGEPAPDAPAPHEEVPAEHEQVASEA